MVQVTYPGVYVQEVSSGVRAVTGVSTSIAAFVGMARRGRLRTPTRVLGYADFERAFGSDATLGELPVQVRQFFLNGGQEAFIVRVAAGAEAADVVIDGKLKLTAKDAGALGDTLRARVDYNTATPEATFNLTVFRETMNASGQPLVSELELHQDLSMDPASARHAATYVTRESRLVKAETVGTPTSEPGFSISAAMPASAATFINDKITGDFATLQVRVGPSGWQTVSVPKNAGPTGLQSAINTVLAGTGASVTVSGPDNAPIVITAATVTGGSQHDVQVRPGAVADLAVPLGLGSAQGGIEQGAYSKARPKPSGGISGGAGLLAYLNSVAGLTRPTKVSMAGAQGITESALSYPATGATLGAGSVSGASLLNVRENLNAIASKINAVTNDWRATVVGLRLALQPTYGTALAGATRKLVLDGSVLDMTSLAGASALGSLGGGKAGNDGQAPGVKEYQEAFEELDKIDLFNLMVLPESATPAVQRKAVWGIASAFCRQKRAFLLVDPDSTWDSVEEVDAGVDTLRIGLAADHAALYWPRLEVQTDGGRKLVDPSGSVAGLMARIDSSRGVWKAPAGLEASLTGVLGVAVPLSDRQNGVLNPKAVNVLRAFPSGIVSWGARTLDGFDNSGNDDYKYVPVRRLALFIEESLVRGLKFAVFEPNDERLWSQLRLAAGGFMNGLFRRGAFAGPKKDDAYFVKVDRETTTQNDINLGIVNVVVGFAALKPAEFVVITLQQMAGQVQV